MKKTKIKKNITLGMLSALAYVSLFFIKFPIIPSATYLSCDVKDVIILIGACVFDPISGLLMALVVSFIQMFTISQYGIIGFFMNVISTTAFVLPASIIFHKKKNTIGLILGLCMGCILMTLIMLLWNYIMTPLYMNASRDIVKNMLIPVFLPFNIIKSVINAILSFILFKVVVERIPAYRMKENE